MAVQVSTTTLQTQARPYRVARRHRPARVLSPAALVIRTANGQDSVSVSPAATSPYACWLTVRSAYGDRESTSEVLLDRRQVRRVGRLLARAGRRLLDGPTDRASARAVEDALRVAEREWLDEQGGLELPEDF